MRGNNSGNYKNPCLTMHQPWASLLVHGIKRIEGRSWPAPIRGRLWIHAASKVPDESTIKAMEYFYREIYAVNGITDIKFPEHYPTSRLLGCVDVVGCLRQEELACWDMVPESVRLEAQTNYCWLCEYPQKLLTPFEMRGFQGVYNLEKKIYEAVVRGLSPVTSLLPAKFPLPDLHDSFSLQPGCISVSSPNLKASSEADGSSTLSMAITGAREASVQFSKKDQNSRTTVQNNKPYKTNTSHEETKNVKSYNLRSLSRSRDKDKPSSTNFSEIFDDGTLPLHHEDKRSYRRYEIRSRYNQYRGADERQPLQQPAKGSMATKKEEKSRGERYEESSRQIWSPGAALSLNTQPPSRIFAAAIRGLKP
ncbi:hypothetical protein K1719_006141 [Acacia pycnantha]|nr:hypothetical protein K1719_006141 [Acacia pycnantha]